MYYFNDDGVRVGASSGVEGGGGVRGTRPDDEGGRGVSRGGRGGDKYIMEEEARL